jgi:hypothetical protein
LSAARPVAGETVKANAGIGRAIQKSYVKVGNDTFKLHYISESRIGIELAKSSERLVVFYCERG